MALPAGVRSLPASSICERRRASRQTIEELQMPHFELDLDQDGSARAIYKDGELIDGALSLESPNSIVQTYFVSAVRNIDAMTVGDDPDGTRARDQQHYCLQDFLMTPISRQTCD